MPVSKRSVPSQLSQFSKIGAFLVLGFAALWAGQSINGQAPTGPSQSSPLSAQPSAQGSNSQAAQTTSPALPRGKKLFLKDGSFQLVREYKVDGDRVRYYSLDSSQWEEMPAALVDWDATKNTEAEEARRDAAVIAKVNAQEKARNTELKLDIDASLEAAPGVFLPPGEGLFAFDGKAILPLTQAATSANLDKKQLLKQVLVPVPIVSTRHTVSIAGPRAHMRLKTGQPEFYMRTADGREPEMELVHVHVHGDTRQVENLDQLFGQTRTTRDSISMQQWTTAPGVTRYTLSQPLAPGEYVFMEIVQSQEHSLFVWDFGVDGGASRGTAKSN
jgi:hypothetical protein